jgi:hypothetical protein
MITLKLDDGRELGIAPAAPHEAMKLAEGCRELSGVRQWWHKAMSVAAVRTIDGIPLPAPTHERHVEGLVARFSRSDLKKIIAARDEAESADEAPELEFKEITPLEELRLWALIGDFDTIPAWVATAFIAAPVRKIGSEAVSFPASKDEMKALVERLGVAGMNQASVFLLASKAAEKAAEADKVAAAKN